MTKYLDAPLMIILAIGMLIINFFGPFNLLWVFSTVFGVLSILAGAGSLITEKSQRPYLSAQFVFYIMLVFIFGVRLVASFQ